ncbi:MAG: HNH endonuclease [Gammaproteobacteria bacterium]|nr:HNH endonuclease [Gammaproteobacteria bacterium]
MDAHFEIQDGKLILCSRGGTLGTSNARNTEYGPALRILLKRIERSNLALIGVWVDSNHVQNLSMKERQIFSIKDPEVSSSKLFTMLSNRMAAVGRDPSISGGGGNSTKRLCFAFAGNPPDELVARVVGWGETDPSLHQYKNKSDIKFSEATSCNMYSVPPSPEDCEWAEGYPRLVLHLCRERKRGLASIKKLKFIRDHGRLFCEHCGLEPTKTYGHDTGDACIEVHHKHPIADQPLGRITRLEDLACLCANCHRVLHRELQNAAKKT